MIGTRRERREAANQHELMWAESVDVDTGYHSQGWVCACGFHTDDSDEADAHLGIVTPETAQRRPYPET